MALKNTWLFGGERAGLVPGDEFDSCVHPDSRRENDSNTYCVTSLRLGNTARADIMEGDVSGALKPPDSRREK